MISISRPALRLSLSLTTALALGACDAPLDHLATDDATPTALPDAGVGPSFDDARASLRVEPGLEELLIAGPVRLLVVFSEHRRATPPAGRARAVASSIAEDIAAHVPLERRLLVATELPIVALEIVDARELRALVDDARIVRIEHERTFTADAVPSLEMIAQPAALARGADGRNVAVAVLDTGTDYTRSEFACTAPDVPSGCGVVVARDFAPNDSALDAPQRHGTNVAAIVRMVAPSARILALDVFNGAGASSTDIIAALDWVIAQRDTYGIGVVNMSLGGGAFTSLCANDAMGVAVSRVRAAGIAPAVATGNNGYTNAVASPACSPGAISVGAVDTSGVVTSFSNSASFVSLLAPGVSIAAGGVTMSGTSQASPHVAGALAALRSAFPSESVDAIVERLRVTGVATTDARNGVQKPRIDVGAASAGCIVSTATSSVSFPDAGGARDVAITASDASCSYDVTDLPSWLSASRTSGVGSGTLTLTVGPHGGAARSASIRIGGRAVSVSQAADTTPPTGTLRLSASVTRTPSLTYTLSASDPAGVTSMCIAATNRCTTFVPFATSGSITLPSGDGPKTVYAFLRDARGNTSSATNAPTAPVTLDATAPTSGTLTVRAGIGSLRITGTNFVDRTSPIVRYRVVFQTGTVAPPTCDAGTLVGEPLSLDLVHSGLTVGTTYRYRVCAIDDAGNRAAGVTGFGVPVPELDAPTGGSIVLAGGATSTRLTSGVAATVSATDNSGVASMCISSTATCTAFVRYAATTTVTLGGTGRVRTASVWFRDTYGNVSAPVSDTIEIDNVAPANPTVTATSSGGALSLGWSPVTDAAATTASASSGLASYRVLVRRGSAPTTCSGGSDVSASSVASSFRQESLVAGAAYGYRVCAVDAVGNASSGAAGTITIVR